LSDYDLVSEHLKDSKMILSIAWRNIWRSRTRSIVIIVALTLGLFAGVFNISFYKGMVVQRIQSAIGTEVSHIQLHKKNYLTNPEKSLYMTGSDTLQHKIEKIQGVSAVSSRIITTGMVQSANTGRGVKIVGINPADEKRVTNLYSKLLEGDYFESQGRNPVLIGQKLAEKLKVGLRSKIVVTFQDMQGNLTGASFRVVGIYKTSNSMYDETNLFVRDADLAVVMQTEQGCAHEMAVLIEDNSMLDTVKNSVMAIVPQHDVKTWRELMPDVNLIETSLDLSMYILMGIILLALIFGIINTMLMAVLERIKELGMLMAIGMNKKRVFSMIMTETVMLSLVGGLTGIIFGVALTYAFSQTGIDLSSYSQAWERMGYDSIIYPVITVRDTVVVTIMVIATGILAAIYPARKALKLNPADAIRIDM
jgi:putative ABC transport system permease protein